MSGLDNSAKTHIPALPGLKTAKIQYPGTVNTLERKKELRSSFFIFGNVRQFISNSNSSNTKCFYNWPISNSSNTPISNYFLTVRTKEEFTVLSYQVHKAV